jgi:hypothetical protein
VIRRIPIPAVRKTCRSRRRPAKYTVQKLLNRSQGGSPTGAPDRDHYHCRLQKLIRLNIPPACRFHQPPNRRRLQPVRGPAFTSEPAQVSARPSPKSATSGSGQLPSYWVPSYRVTRSSGGFWGGFCASQLCSIAVSPAQHAIAREQWRPIEASAWTAVAAPDPFAKRNLK